MERNMLDYLPDALRPYRELRAMAAGWQALFDGLWRAADQALDDQFVTTAGEYGLSRWESMLGIRAKGTESLDKRRARVLSRLLEQLPFTMRGLLVDALLLNKFDHARHLPRGDILPGTSQTIELLHGAIEVECAVIDRSLDITRLLDEHLVASVDACLTVEGLSFLEDIGSDRRLVESAKQLAHEPYLVANRVVTP